jgi:hypothetical protein
MRRSQFLQLHPQLQAFAIPPNIFREPTRIAAGLFPVAPAQHVDFFYRARREQKLCSRYHLFILGRSEWFDSAVIALPRVSILNAPLCIQKGGKNENFKGRVVVFGDE